MSESIAERRKFTDFKKSRLMHALVVDDDEESVELLANLMRKRGHVVNVVDEGARALTLCQERTYDLLFIDYHMPGLNGDNVIDIVRNWSHDSLIFVFTGDHSEECVEKFRMLDVDGIILKPADSDTVHDLLHHLESRRDIDDQIARRLIDGIIFPKFRRSKVGI